MQRLAASFTDEAPLGINFDIMFDFLRSNVGRPVPMDTRQATPVTASSMGDSHSADSSSVRAAPFGLFFPNAPSTYSTPFIIAEGKNVVAAEVARQVSTIVQTSVPARTPYVRNR